LRQIHTYNFLYLHPSTAQAQGITDGGWMWIESMHGKVRCMARFSEAVEPGTVWTWNAVGKASGAWNLDGKANESKQGFLLNHIIGEELPANAAGEHISNSDPVTGQAGWYDVRVRVYKAGDDEPKETWPQYNTMPSLPGTPKRRPWQNFFAGLFTDKGGK
jgi:anaerobic selenocysteine-containing dehydrogenase